MKTRRETGRGFADYYVKQSGTGMPIYSGASMQRGHGDYGLGNMVRGLFRYATPLIKTVGKEALIKSKPILKKIGRRVLKRGIEELANATPPKIMKIVGESVRSATKNSRGRPPQKRGRPPKTRGRPLKTRGRPLKNGKSPGRPKVVSRDIFSS